MKNTLRRMLTLALCAIMVMALLPASLAFADDEGGAPTDTGEPTVPENNLISGNNGGHQFFVFNNTQVEDDTQLAATNSLPAQTSTDPLSAQATTGAQLDESADTTGIGISGSGGVLYTATR